MEKDSFEELLRGKVEQAESALNTNSDKEKVWNSIQKRQQPRRKFYYAAAAILLIIGMGSLFYMKTEEAIIIAKTTKTEKPIIAFFPKPLVVEPARVKQEMAPVKKAEMKPLALVKPVEGAAPIPNTVAHKEGHSIAVLPEPNEIVAVIPKNVNTETKIIPLSAPIVPEFTVQLKRGAIIANNADENIIITSLKKFKLKRDTTYFANAEEKHSTKIKLTFKKEN